MRKIKIAHSFLKVLNTILIFGIINYLRIPFFKMPWETIENLNAVKSPSLVSFYTNMIFACVFLIGSILIQKSFYHIIKIGFFNKKSTSLLKKAGFIFIINSVIHSFFFTFNTSTFYQKLNNIAVEIFIFIVGVGILIFSDIMKKGNDLKTENDLTI